MHIDTITYKQGTLASYQSRAHKRRNTIPTEFFYVFNTELNLYKIDKSFVLHMVTSEILIKKWSALDLFWESVGLPDPQTETLSSNGGEGFLQYGPYMKLEPGQYKVEWTGWAKEVPEGEQGFVDVSYGFGESVIKKEPISLNIGGNSEESVIAEIEFALDESLHHLEYRIYVKKGVLVTLKKIILKKLFQDETKETGTME